MNALDFLSSQYEKIRLLKQTDHSEVWLATDKHEQMVILKRLHKTGLPIRLLKDAKIPLLPQVYYVTETKTETITVEEYIIGTSLAQYKNENHFITPQEAEKILLALCDGLAAMHTLGVIHRDIKPAHIIIEKDGKPRLIDFDTCRRIKYSQTEDTELLGTKTYAPPEQFGFQQTDCRSDIYSLGQTISELLPPNYHGNLLPILKRCKRLDPADRYQTMDELSKAIKQPAISKKIALLLLLPIIAMSVYLYPYHNHPEQTPSNTIEENVTPPPTTTESPRENNSNPPVEQPATSPTPAATTSPAPITVPPKSSPAETPVPSKPTTNYIRVQYFWKGNYTNRWMENFDTDIDNSGTTIKIPRTFWEQQNNPQGIIHLSPADTLSLRISNQSPQPLSNAYVTIQYCSSNFTETQNIPIQELAANETTDINIPIDRYPIINPQKITNQTIGQLTIKVNSSSSQEIRCSRYYFCFICMP